MPSLTLALYTLLLASSASAQLLQFGTGQLPSCAQSCTNLVNAQAACYPSSAQPVSCFCQSAYLQTLKLSADGTCDSECTSESDRQQIFSWYAGYCANGGAAASASLAAAQAGATTLATQATSAILPAQTTQYIPAGTGAATANPVSSETKEGTWWDNHARWIAMVIVLVVVFAIIIGVGVWAKKRYIRKRDQALAGSAPAGWGPSNPHAAGGLDRSNEKTTARAMAQSTGPPGKGKSTSGRLSRNSGR